MPKQLIFSEAARNEILQGVSQLSKAVKATLGPKGRNVSIEKKFHTPVITKDGVTVAKEIELVDPYQNMGAQMVKEVASKTNDIAGDGTTTATVLAEAIYREGLKNVTAGANPMCIKRGIDKAASLIINEIIAMSKSVDIEGDDLRRVATISANGDSSIGDIIVKAFQQIGPDSPISVEESGTPETSLDMVEGMQFDRGYLSTYFITDTERSRVELKDCNIIISEKKINSFLEIHEFLKLVAKQGAPILFIADDFEAEVMRGLIANKVRGLQICPIKAPGFGDRRKAMLQDIAILTGGEVISDESGVTFTKYHGGIIGDKNIQTILGTAARVVITKDDTTIIEGCGEPANIKSRIDSIRNELETASSEYDKEKLQERLAKLSGGVAVIRVGAFTEAEMKEKKDRFDDALNATRAAIAEGIVPGGGVALIRAAAVLKDIKLENDDEELGAAIVAKAIEEPLRQLVSNGGGEGGIVVGKVKELTGNMGFDVAKGEYVDMLEKGIIDPAKVTRTALQNASSIAGLLLTTECLIADMPEIDNLAAALTPSLPANR